MGFFDDDEPGKDDAREALVASLKGQHQGVHNFTVGTLSCYFRLLTLRADNISWDGTSLLLSGLPGSGSRKTFVYGRHIEEAQLRDWRRDGVVYSIHQLPSGVTNKFSETCYSLPDVFDGSSYPTAKKRHQRIKYPRTWIAQRYQVRQITKADLPAAKALHDAWVAHKLSLPDTFQMMFPKARYLACLQMALDRPHEYWTLGAWDANGVLHAVRALYVEKPAAFDMAFFANTWDAPSNLTEHFAVECMGRLHDEGYLTLNCGAGLHKKLSAFKDHWPHARRISFAYPKLK